jgi:aarF domain-containing kinase
MLFSVGDDVKNTYEGMERSGRVASTLILCINE